MYTDTELVDFLEMTHRENEYAPCVTLRQSLTGRGWRLHSCSEMAAHSFDVEVSSTVRDAITMAMERRNDND